RSEFVIAFVVEETDKRSRFRIGRNANDFADGIVSALQVNERHFEPQRWKLRHRQKYLIGVQSFIGIAFAYVSEQFGRRRVYGLHASALILNDKRPEFSRMFRRYGVHRNQ